MVLKKLTFLGRGAPRLGLGVQNSSGRHTRPARSSPSVAANDTVWNSQAQIERGTYLNVLKCDSSPSHPTELSEPDSSRDRRTALSQPSPECLLFGCLVAHQIYRCCSMSLEQLTTRLGRVMRFRAACSRAGARLTSQSQRLSIGRARAPPSGPWPAVPPRSHITTFNQLTSDLTSQEWHLHRRRRLTRRTTWYWTRPSWQQRGRVTGPSCTCWNG